MTSQVLRWSAPTDGCDGMAVTDELVLVAGPEVLNAYDRADGSLRWSAQSVETEGPTPVVVVGGVVVVVPEWDDPVAFDLAAGELRDVPEDLDVPPPAGWDQPRVPEGFEVTDAGLVRDGVVVLPEFDEDDSWAARVGALTVVTCFESGVQVVDDTGALLAAPPLGAPGFDETPIVVDGAEAFVVAVDGVLHAVDAVRSD